MKIAVLGCGPAGLIAAHAAEMSGHSVAVLSKRAKSIMPGAQYLHERIPKITPYEPTGYLRVVKEGTAEGYAQKVYGDPFAPVSWNSYNEGHYPAWSLADTYEKLWGLWEEHILDVGVLSHYEVCKVADQFDVVLSTIPAPVWHRHKVLGGEDCKFEVTKVWFTNRAWNGCEMDTIIYNGESSVPWYRTSVIFGHESTEWPYHPNDRAVAGVKPVRSSCQCQPENVIKVGRFGKWDKSVLVHHVYKEVIDALQRV